MNSWRNSLPYAVFWIHLLPIYTLIWICDHHSYDGSAPCLLFNVLQGMAGVACISNLFPRIIDDILEILVLRFNEINTPKLSGILKLWSYTCPILFFLHFSSSLTYFSRFLDHKWSGLDVACRFVNLLHGPRVSVWGFSFDKVNCVKHAPWIRQISWPINVPIVINAAFLQHIQGRMSSSWWRQYISVE